MKNILMMAVATTALLAAPAVASAQSADDTQGWYLRGNLGIGAFTDMELSDDMIGDTEAEANGVGSIGLGYDLGNNWRVELDGSTMWNDLGAIDQTPESFAKFRGNGLMLNAIYDFNDFGRWAPYVGAGIGLLRGDLSAESHDYADPNNPLLNIDSRVCGDLCTVADQSATSTAWNLLAGLGYDISENLVWDTQYRYLQAEGMTFDGVQSDYVFPGPVETNPRGINVNLDDIGAHQLMTGFRYRFGGTKAPMAAKVVPVAKPEMPVQVTQITCWDGSMRDSFAQCPSEPQTVVEQPTIQCFDGTLVYDQASCPTPPPPPVIVEQAVSICDQGDVPFVVYFEWDKSRLTDQAQAVIDQASTYTQQCGVDAVSVEGYTDTSGAAAYNIALSNRRADTVANALVSKGVDAQRISRSGLGEQGLAVQTEDGVREPLNRRSEVVIRLVPTYGF